MSRSDPIRQNYYGAVELADRVSNWMFYTGAILSGASLLADKTSYPLTADWISIAFAISVSALFVVGLASRLYWTPRAESKRRQDFITSAYRVNLTHEKTDGYYNNNFDVPIKRIAAQLLENSHFSKAITLCMAKGERTRIVVYSALWLICLLNRRTDMDVVLVVSQVVFSEQVLARWVRLEWLRMQCEKTFDEGYRLLQLNPAAARFYPMTLEALLTYETAKSNAAITLSSKIFDEMNPALSVEWDAIKAALKI